MPAKLSARARLFDTGHNHKADAHDAHSVAVVAVRTRGLRVLSYDSEFEALRMPQRAHPGKAKKTITAGQAKTILATVLTRDLTGKTVDGSRSSNWASQSPSSNQSSPRPARGTKPRWGLSDFERGVLLM